jgi:putative tryptophan/tyrosine transport system substrate-binding protein
LSTRRRVLIALAAAALPIRAGAQRKARRVALLSASSAAPWTFLRDALERLGLREGTDIVLDPRSAEGKFQRLDELAMDIVRSRPHVIVAHEAAALMAAKKATSRIPIVMAAADDLAPGGNVTGLATNALQFAARIVDLIREVKSNARRLAVLASADDPSTRGFVASLNQAAARIRVPIGLTRVRTAEDYDAAFAQWERLRLQALIVHPSADKARAAELALRYRVPAIAAGSGFVEAGGLLSYSENPRVVGRTVASYIDRILKGAKPADLPLEQLAAFDLALNLKTARTLEVELPDSLIARADALLQ